jgi:hypothetical protein
MSWNGKEAPLAQSKVYMNPDEVFARIAEARKREKTPRFAGDETSKEYAKWCDSKNFADVEELTWKGWPKGAGRIRKMFGEVEPVIQELRDRVVRTNYDVAGEWLNIDRLLQGEAECWGGRTDGDQGSDKFVRLDCSLSCSAAMTSEAFFQRGAAAILCADALEAMGRRVEIWAASGELYDRKIWNYRILLKAAHESVDLERVAAVLAHPGFFRRAGFNLMAADGYQPGSPAEYHYAGLPPEHRHYGNQDGGVITIGSMHLNDVVTAGGFKKFLLAKMEQAGIRTEGMFQQD